VQHGEWKPWLKRHCHGISYPTLVRYMRLADHNKTAEVLKEKDFETSYRESGITDLNAKKKERETAVKNIKLTLTKLKELMKKYRELRPLVAELAADVSVLSPAKKVKKKFKTVKAAA
jgi:UDP-N-acetylenolpyruvoylglucosamine reductase